MFRDKLPFGGKALKRRTRGRSKWVFWGPGGRLYERKWPKGWKPKQGQPSIPRYRTPWKQGRGGRRYALLWYFEADRCGRCGGVRASRPYLRLFVCGGAKGQRWVRSKRVNAFPGKVSQDTGPFSYKPEQFGRWLPGLLLASNFNEPHEITCTCRKQMLPRGLGIRITLPASPSEKAEMNHRLPEGIVQPLSVILSEA